MAIKSALELAMERASHIKVDKVEIIRKNLEQNGKEAASQFLNKPKYDFQKWFNELEKSETKDTISGVIWVFIKNISLPNSTADIDKVMKIKEGFNIISDKNSQIEDIFTQLITAFSQYIDNSKTLLEHAKTEFAPTLQQKALQIAQQTGQMVPIEPETDRDFIAYHKEQQVQVDDHYKAYITQVTDTLKALF